MNKNWKYQGACRETSSDFRVDFYELMDERFLNAEAMNGWMKTNLQTNAIMNEPMTECMYERMDQAMHKWIQTRMNASMNCITELQNGHDSLHNLGHNSTHNFAPPHLDSLRPRRRPLLKNRKAMIFGVLEGPRLPPDCSGNGYLFWFWYPFPFGFWGA